MDYGFNTFPFRFMEKICPLVVTDMLYINLMSEKRGRSNG